MSYTQIYDPLGSAAPLDLVGSLRVVEEDEGLTFSGDLYTPGPAEPIDPTRADGDLIVELPDPRDGVPVLAIHAYHSYIRGLGVEGGSTPGTLVLSLERYAYNVETRAGPMEARSWRPWNEAGRTASIRVRRITGWVSSAT
jgi:hypothetical protein